MKRDDNIIPCWSPEGIATFIHTFPCFARKRHKDSDSLGIIIRLKYILCFGVFALAIITERMPGIQALRL